MPTIIPISSLQQPVIHLDLQGFAPDLDPSTHGIFTDTTALVSTDEGYFTNAPTFTNIGSGPGTNCGGAFWSPTMYLPGNGGGQEAPGALVAGFFDGKLYALENASFVEYGGGTVYASVLTAPVGALFRFAQFGNHIIATSFGGIPAVWKMLPSGVKFTTLTGTPPAGAVIVSASNNFVFIANSTLAGNDWTCCAQGDDSNWTPNNATMCATGALIDTAGPITAMRTLWRILSFATYKLSATYLTQFIGPPIIWQFIPISTQIGTFSQESVVDIGGIHVFPSLYDFYSFDGANLTKIDTPLRQWFYDNLNIQAVTQPLSNATNLPQSNVIGSFDQINNTVYWFFPTTGTTLDTWIAWNIKSNVWTKGATASHVTGTVLPFLGPYSQWGNPNTLQNSIYAASVFEGTNLYSVGGPNYVPDLTSTFTTGDLGDGLHYYLVTRIRPHFETFPSDTTDVTITGYTKENLGTTATQITGPVPLDDSGWWNLRQAGRWHSFKITLGSSCQLSSLEVEAIPQGVR